MNNKEWVRMKQEIAKEQERSREIRERVSKRVAEEDARAVAAAVATGNKLRDGINLMRAKCRERFSKTCAGPIGVRFMRVFDDGNDAVIVLGDGRYAQISYTGCHYTVRCQDSWFCAVTDGTLEQALQLVENYVKKNLPGDEYNISEPQKKGQKT